ncbi:MAG: acyltransferase [Rhodoglobus sp.]
MKLRRKGLIGVFNKASHFYWLAKSALYYGPQFDRFGSKTILRKPMFIGNPGGISIGRDTSIRDGVRLEVVDRPGEAPGRLVIGDRVNFEQSVHVAACGEIIIEDDVCIAAGTSILDSTHPVGAPGDGNRVRFIQSGPAFVHIGKRVFVGTGCVILPNVSIGDNSIIGAGSVVTHNIPADSIAVGSPARVIKTIVASQS